MFDSFVTAKGDKLFLGGKPSVLGAEVQHFPDFVLFFSRVDSREKNVPVGRL
jgi:hypothetical protein